MKTLNEKIAFIQLKEDALMEQCVLRTPPSWWLTVPYLQGFYSLSLCFVLFCFEFLFLYEVLAFLWRCPGYFSLLKLRRKGFIWLSDYSASSREACTRAQGSKLEVGTEAEPWRNAVDWLAPHDLIVFFFKYILVEIELHNFPLPFPFFSPSHDPLLLSDRFSLIL